MTASDKKTIEVEGGTSNHGKEEYAIDMEEQASVNSKSIIDEGNEDEGGHQPPQIPISH